MNNARQIKRQQWCRLALWLLLAGQLLAMTYLAVKPALAVMTFSNSDKLLHFIAYFTLMIWPFFLFKQQSVFLKSALMAFMYGIMIELMQATLPNRFCSMADIAANLTGIVLLITVVQCSILQQAKQWLHVDAANP